MRVLQDFCEKFIAKHFDVNFLPVKTSPLSSIEFQL